MSISNIAIIFQPHSGQYQILNVRIYPLPEMRQCKVAEKLCEIMNESETCYPGTEWKLHYEMLKAATGVGERGFS